MKPRKSGGRTPRTQCRPRQQTEKSRQASHHEHGRQQVENGTERTAEPRTGRTHPGRPRPRIYVMEAERQERRQAGRQVQNAGRKRRTYGRQAGERRNAYPVPRNVQVSRHRQNRTVPAEQETRNRQTNGDPGRYAPRAGRNGRQETQNENLFQN